MFYVTSLNGNQIEPLINIGDDFQMKQSVNGNFNVSFTCFPGDKNPGYDLLGSEAIININDYEFVVKQYSGTIFSKNVTAVSSFFELSKRQKYGVFNQEHTLNNHLNFALSSQGWSYTIDDDIFNERVVIEDFGNDNVISLVETITQYYRIEYIILPNNNVRFSKRIGGNKDYQYRYKHNVDSVVLKEDSSKLYTLIRGFGANDLQVVYVSPNFNIYGEKEADAIRDDRFTDAESLTNFIKNSISDVPELAIETVIPELTSRDTGETIWLIYEPLGIEMQTRILEQTKILVNDELVTSSVVFGNSLLQSSIDLLVSQKREIDDNKDYINETSERLTDSQDEYRSSITTTNNRITAEVEQIGVSIASVDIKADNINLSVNNRITNEVAAIDIRANAIDLSVRDLDSRTSSSINLLQNNINLKVDVGGSITDINLSPGNATINANRIDLNGAVFVNGSITGSTFIEVDTDVILGRMLRFSDFTALTTGGGNLTLEAQNAINYVGTTHYFNGVVDFSNATVIGLP